MAKRAVITDARLRAILHYDPLTGIFTRMTSGSGKGMLAGSRAGTLKKHGYRTIDVDGRRYYEHWLAWLYMTGEAPPADKLVDHRDTIRSRNIWENLRLANRQQNVANRRMNKTNRIGLKGVRKHASARRAKRFGAHIKVDYCERHLGWFDCPAAAHFAYIIAASIAFGEFARAA